MNLSNLRRLVIPTLGAIAVAVAVSHASPLPPFNQPIDTIQAGLNAVIAEVNGQVQSATLTSCTTNATSANATCNGLRDDVSVTSLTTATNGAVSNAITVNDSQVTAASQVMCQPNGYAGIGTPTDVNVVPAANSFTFQIQNTGVGGNAINATVTSDCLVFN